MRPRKHIHLRVKMRDLLWAPQQLPWNPANDILPPLEPSRLTRHPPPVWDQCPSSPEPHSRSACSLLGPGQCCSLSLVSTGTLHFLCVTDCSSRAVVMSLWGKYLLSVLLMPVRDFYQASTPVLKFLSIF